MVISPLFLNELLGNIALSTMGHLCGHCILMELNLSVLPGERH